MPFLAWDRKSRRVILLFLLIVCFESILFVRVRACVWLRIWSCNCRRRILVRTILTVFTSACILVTVDMLDCWLSPLPHDDDNVYRTWRLLLHTFMSCYKLDTFYVAHTLAVRLNSSHSCPPAARCQRACALWSNEIFLGVKYLNLWTNFMWPVPRVWAVSIHSSISNTMRKFTCI